MISFPRPSLDLAVSDLAGHQVQRLLSNSSHSAATLLGLLGKLELVQRDEDRANQSAGSIAVDLRASSAPALNNTIPDRYTHTPLEIGDHNTSSDSGRDRGSARQRFAPSQSDKAKPGRNRVQWKGRQATRTKKPRQNGAQGKR